MTATPKSIPLDFRTLGPVSLDAVLRLQSRLRREVHRSASPRTIVLFCEHPRSITIGRDGSRAQVRWTDEHLRRKRLGVRYVARRGGCVLHEPGQLAVYTVACPAAYGWRFGEFRKRFRQAMVGALEELGISPTADAERRALVGRSGVLASLGLTGRSGVTAFGAYLNVNPRMVEQRCVDAAQTERGPQTMSSLATEGRGAARMPRVRTALVAALADAFGVAGYHLQAGHPLLGADG